MTFDESKVTREGNGQFGAKPQSEPEVALGGPARGFVRPSNHVEANSKENRAAARAILNEPAPEGMSPDAKLGWESANNFLGGQADITWQYQPLSYIARVAEDNYQLTLGRDGEMWEGRRDRLDVISEHLHAHAGTYRSPQRAPEHRGDDTRSGDDVLKAVYGDYSVAQLKPVGLTETRASLANTNGSGPGAIRHVELTWDSVPAASDGKPLQVKGPRDGRPILVHVRTGCPTVEVTSGHAVIIAGGNGFGITVTGDGRATVIGEPGRKVHVTAEAGSIVDYYPDATTRGYCAIRPGAEFRMHGDAREMHLSSDLS